jgi:hypothetical protein
MRSAMFVCVFFPQVRKLDHNNVEPELVQSINRFRDNVAHIVTHQLHGQTDHWKQFMTQQGR